MQETTTIRKVFLRLLPLLFVSYLASYFDRVNMSFAALTMNHDIGLTPYLFGIGAGVFYVGYFLFEIPSNLMLERFGARRWIARIMLSWGLLSAAMMFVRGPLSLCALRFLLGAAEAGFFPGVILYLTYWFPRRYRARIIAAFMIAIPVSVVIGAPLSVALLRLDGLLALHGWQWLFLLEGMPPILLAAVVLVWLPDRPRDAAWLSDEERRWLSAELEAETREVAPLAGGSLIGPLIDPRVLCLAVIYFCATAINLGLILFLPQILNGSGLFKSAAGLLSAIPAVFGTIGILVWGVLTDRSQRPRRWLLIAFAVSGIGLLGAGFAGLPAAVIALLSAASIGIYGSRAAFWPLPSAFLSGRAAAVGIAFINAVGNLGGFAGPWAVGLARQTTHGFAAGLTALAALSASGAIATWVLPHLGPPRLGPAHLGPAHPGPLPGPSAAPEFAETPNPTPGG